MVYPCTLASWGQPSILSFFETSSGLVAHGSPIVTTGKAGLAVSLVRALKQWVDLGDVSGYSSFSLPETCGSNGASLTAWNNLIDCPSGSGFISSRAISGSTGFVAFGVTGGINYILHQSDKGYAMYIDGKPTGWFHLTVVYHGDGNDVDIYYDGQRKDTFSPGSSTVPSGSGHIVIGRRFIDQDNYYATVEIDELTLWNN